MRRLVLGCLLVVLLSASFVAAQVEPNLEQGMKPYGSYHGGDIDTVSLSNGNLRFKVDLMSYPQRGDLRYPIVLTYESKSFALKQKSCVPNTNVQSPRPALPCPYVLTFGPPSGLGIASNGNSVTVGFEGVPAAIGSAHIYTGLSFNGNPIWVWTYAAFMPDGAELPLVKTDNGWVTIDGSGFRAADPSSSLFIVDSNGTGTASLGSIFGNNLSGSAMDRNGNTLSVTQDTLGRAMPVRPGPAPTDTPPASTANIATQCPALNYPNQPVTSAYLWSPPTVGGGALTLTLCYATVYVHPSYGSVTNPTTGGIGFNMLQSVVLPDQTYWAFQYDSANPADSTSIGFGDLLKIVFPTGGSIAYTYTDINPCSGYYSSGMNLSMSRAVATRTVDANDGTGPHTWSYAIAGASSTTPTLVQTNTVTAPDGGATSHTFTGLGGTCSLYETQTQYRQPGGAVMKTVQTDYQYSAPNPWDPNLIAGIAGSDSVTNVLPIRVTTTWANGQTSSVETDYDLGIIYHGPLDGIQSNVNTCPTDPYTAPADQQPCGYQGGPPNPVTNYTASYGKPIAVREFDYGQGGTAIAPDLDHLHVAG